MKQTFGSNCHREPLIGAARIFSEASLVSGIAVAFLTKLRLAVVTAGALTIGHWCVGNANSKVVFLVRSVQMLRRHWNHSDNRSHPGDHFSTCCLHINLADTGVIQ